MFSGNSRGNLTVCDTVAEVTIPVLGVVIEIYGVCEPNCDGERFCMTIKDLDTGEEFKKIHSNDLKDLLHRQHQLTLGFAE